jgi:TRAP-type mannitol/chloroaromatic compound transport system permease small subunit
MAKTIVAIAWDQGPPMCFAAADREAGAATVLRSTFIGKRAFVRGQEMRRPRFLAFADAIDRLTESVGRVAAWLALVIVVLQFALVVARYLFSLGSIWASEAVIYAHAGLFLLAAAWTLQVGGHVRVDIFYADARPRTKARIDLIGGLLFLLPFALLLLWLSAPYAGRSWAVLEHSQEASGFPLVFVLKTLIPVFAVLMALQGVAQIIRAASILRATR